MRTCPCGEPLTGRADARYCSPRCCQAAYRTRSKVKGERRDDGWPGQHCAQVTEDSRLCAQLAAWELHKQDNRGSHVGGWAVSYWCDEHLPRYLGRYGTVAVGAEYTSVQPRQ